MLRFLVLVLAVGQLNARPSDVFFPSIGGHMIVGGVDASPGEFPWQLSQQRLSGSNWSHSCGSSLLDASRTLTAAHCVDGASATIIRVLAGLHQRSQVAGSQTAGSARHALHGSYNNGQATYSHDIAIIHLQTPITTVNGRIHYAILPPNNNNNLAGLECVISGWGRNSNAQTLPDTLQKAPITCLSTADCRTRMSAVGGASIWDNHLCVYDSAQQRGSCNGDSGGPLNCPLGGNIVVAGVTSWGISGLLGNCQQSYPSVYTRTSTYLDWIDSN